MIKIGRRGSLSGKITVHGVQGHAAYPHLADNPVRGMLQLTQALMDPPFDAGTGDFQPSNLEVTTIDVGNPATNVIPAKASASFNIRFNDSWTAETLRAEILRRLDAAAGNGALRPGREPVRLRYRLGRPAEPCLPDAQQCADRLAVCSRRKRYRPVAEAFDHRRHIGCALHQGLLPGRRVRPCRPDHAHGRRARRRRRSGDADGRSTKPSSRAGSPMPGFRRFRYYLAGLWLLIRLDPRGFRYLDIRERGVWRSFWAMLWCLPPMGISWLWWRQAFLGRCRRKPMSVFPSISGSASSRSPTGSCRWSLPGFCCLPSGMGERFAPVVVSVNWLGVPLSYINGLLLALVFFLPGSSRPRLAAAARLHAGAGLRAGPHYPDDLSRPCADDRGADTGAARAIDDPFGISAALPRHLSRLTKFTRDRQHPPSLASVSVTGLRRSGITSG